ncbi:TetR/AcrR family transcriptional regulator [Streptomyces sp. DSM 44915]|uniref:TetR/AcrR family transcriptional regulator n=1 Tax=Streptomyces chisholmiae TaxID=3075540 RepID=A0ABU2JT63_9ACTN|nr:TetR/AcrR family transcriptional regulator [Streptomyces sp. DSM 44915]MDT0268186.1 TetR/AcrR family transcriptional regulator [Streptomyces sp. DSM 44915]
MTSESEQTRAAIVRSLELLWRGRGPRTRGPKPGLSLEGIVTAAVALADREGVEALSMRKVAAELGVGTMSLYRYVPGKTELLHLMIDQVAAPPEPVPGEADQDWRTRLERVGRATYQRLQDHPWLLQLNLARTLLGPKALLDFDHSLSVLDGLDLTGREKVSMIVALDSYVTGIARHYVLLRQAAEESGLSDEEFWELQGPSIEKIFTQDDFPHVMRLDEDVFSATPDEITDFGLARVLDGMEAFITARQAARREGRWQPPPAAEPDGECLT